MARKKNTEKEPKAKKQPLTQPGKIKGRIEVSDTRERRDGPGGN